LFSFFFSLNIPSLISAEIEDARAGALSELENATVFLIRADSQLAHKFQDVLTFHGYPYTQHKAAPGWWDGHLPEGVTNDSYDDEYFELN
jgi:hypothetical protein